MHTILASSAAALLAATVASGQTESAPPAPAKKDDGSKIVCKTEEFVGSKIPKRVCMTRSQWEQARQAAAEIMDERQLSGETRGEGPH
jgi:hypothetical protein